MTEQKNEFWSEAVKTKYHPPEGTFTLNSEKIVKILLDGAGNNPHLALERLMFYMNRAGKKLTNAEALEKTKLHLEELIHSTP